MNRRGLFRALAGTLGARFLPLPSRAQDLKYYTPQQFGAAGDGRTDDTVAMAAAFAATAAEGGALYISRGVYIVNPGGGTDNAPLLKLGSNMRVFGEGTIQVKDNCGDYFSLIANPYTLNQTIHDVVIEGITIHQNALMNSSSNIRIAKATTTAQIAIGAFGDVRGVTVRGVTIYASGINTLDVNGQGATDVNIVDCHFYWQKRPTQAAFDNSCIYFSCGLPRVGMVATSGTAVTWVSGDVFLPSQTGRPININGAPYTVKTFVDGHHLALSASAGVQTDVPYVNPQTANVNVRGCVWTADWRDSAVTACELHHCSGEARDNVVAGYQTANILYCTTDFILHGNTGRDLRIACSVWSKTGQAVRNLTISDNIWHMNNADRNAQPTSGIYLWYGVGAENGDFENLDFHDNQIVFQKWSGAGPAPFLSSGISLACQGNITGCKIHHNRIENAPVRGIKIGNSESAVQPVWQRKIYVEDNTVIDAGNNHDAKALFYGAGIWASGNLDDCGIDRNQIHDSGKPRYCARALCVDATGFTFTRVAIGTNLATTEDGSVFPQVFRGLNR